MLDDLASAVFDSQSKAELAIRELRSAGIRDMSICSIRRHDEGTSETAFVGKRFGTGDKPADFIGKVVVGSGVGALLGAAAFAVPGVAPFAAAGAIAKSALGGAALTGTAIGAAVGALSDILRKHGVSEGGSRYHIDRINRGGIFVSVDPSEAKLQRKEVQAILLLAGGHDVSKVELLESL